MSVANERIAAARLGILRRNEDGGLTVVRDLAVRSDRGRDDRPGRSHGLEEGDGQPFPERRQGDEIGSRQQVADIGAMPEQGHRVFEAESRHELGQLASEGAAAGEDDPRRGMARRRSAGPE